MTYFTENNTEGFSASDLAALNEAAKIVIAFGIANDEHRVTDALNNEWFEGASARELADRVLKRLGAN